MKVLKTNIADFTHIVHIADIHVRLLKRHNEYSEVFEKFYTQVKNTPSTTAICILGDVLHNKSDLSPECVQSAKDFLWECSSLRPTILISGNHDCTLANKNRLDSLSPIVDALKHPNLHYLKENGLYTFGDILFNNMSIFSDVTEYIKYDAIPKVYLNRYKHHIALYHGPVNGAMTDLGFSLSNKLMPIEIFDGHDIALLGDIHKAQTLQDYNDFLNKPAVRYPGSIIQQSHGESMEGHGFSLWDLSTKTHTHIEIPNDYGFFTIEVKKGKLVTDLKDIPKKARLRIKCFESITSEVKEALNTVKSVSVIDEVSYVRLEDDSTKTKPAASINLTDIADVTYQNKLLTKFLADRYKITDKTTVDAILELNSNINSKINKDKFAKNVKWIPKRFEFDNMFSYGEGNIIDFSKANNAIGLFAPNACGKSSIFSALAFCVFDKFDRGYKAAHVLNVQKSNFGCKFNFEINGTDFFIEKKGVADRKGNVKVDVKFWKEEGGKKVELNGEARRNTTDIIKDYLGSYDDFILTALSVQGAKNNASFIDMGQSERKDLIAQFIGLTIFDQLLEVSTEESKEIFASLKLYKKDDYNKKLENAVNEHASLKIVLNDEKNKLERLQTSKETWENKLLEETKKLKPVDGESIDITKVESGIKLRNEKLVELINSRSSIEDNIINKKSELTEVESRVLEFDNRNIEHSLIKYQTLTTELFNANKLIDAKKTEVKGKLDKKLMLDKHQYDPNCRFCVNSEFVKDAIRISGELENDKLESKRLLDARDKVSKELENVSWVVESNKIYVTALKQKTLLSLELNNLTSKQSTCEVQISKMESELETLTRMKLQYNNQLETIKSNQNIQINIDSIKNQIFSISSDIKRVSESVLEKNGRMMVLDNQIQQLNGVINKIKELENSCENYSTYIKAVSRDGIPYMIISNTIPEIEREVNNILNQVVEFHINIETDGKNVNPYIAYDDCKWPVEMSSGFERFITSLALRVALIKISNLPRPGFLIVDEGWGTMDSDNLSQVKILLSFLKSNFDFIIIISHLDSIKDSVDTIMEITKLGDFSHIEFK